MPRHWTRPKFTMRRMMVVVAVVAACLSGVRWHHRAEARRLEYQQIAIDHALLVARYKGEVFLSCFGPEVPPSQPGPRKAAYHEEMAHKYDAAAAFPWFPVPSDPPEP